MRSGRHDQNAAHGRILSQFEEAFYPAVNGSASPLGTEGLMSRMMAAVPKHSLELLPQT
jgi:hypothetical protein